MKIFTRLQFGLSMCGIKFATVVLYIFYKRFSSAYTLPVTGLYI